MRNLYFMLKRHGLCCSSGSCEVGSVRNLSFHLCAVLGSKTCVMRCRSVSPRPPLWRAPFFESVWSNELVHRPRVLVIASCKDCLWTGATTRCVGISVSKHSLGACWSNRKSNWSAHIVCVSYRNAPSGDADGFIAFLMNPQSLWCLAFASRSPDVSRSPIGTYHRIWSLSQPESTRIAFDRFDCLIFVRASSCWYCMICTCASCARVIVVHKLS